MHPLSRQFADYCEGHFDLEHQVNYHYQSLPICLIDCVYSLRAKYESITLPVVQRYADAYMGGDRYASGDTISSLIERIDSCGGPCAFAEKVVKEIDEKKAQGIGVFTVDGKMIDIAFYDGAKRTIALAKASGVYKGDL